MHRALCIEKKLMPNKLYNNILDHVGNTPIITLPTEAKGTSIFIKIETFNPTGTVYDRIALGIIENAFENSLLSHGGTVLDAVNDTSMAVSLSMVCAAEGLQCVLVASSSIDDSVKAKLTLYGANVTYVDGDLSFVLRKLQTLSRTMYRGAFVPSMMDVETISLCCMSLAQEIWRNIGRQLGNMIKTIVLPQKAPLVTSIITNFFKTKNTKINFILADLYDPNNPTLDINSIIETNPTMDINYISADHHQEALTELGKQGIAVGNLSATVYASAKQNIYNVNMGENILALLVD